VNPAPDADGGDGQGIGDLFGQKGGNAFQHDGESPCLFEDPGVFHDPLRRRIALALHLVAAQLVDGLRRQPEMGHDGNPGGCDPSRDLCDFPAALQLYSMRARLLQKASGIPDGLLHRDLV